MNSALILGLELDVSKATHMPSSYAPAAKQCQLFWASPAAGAGGFVDRIHQLALDDPLRGLVRGSARRGSRR